MGKGGIIHEDSRETDEVVAAVLRSKTPAENFEMVMSMWRFARDMLTRAVREDHPDWTEERVGREVASRLSHGTI